MGSRFPTPVPQPSGPRFTIGRDHHGCWVVKDRLDRVGGLFASQAAALHFAFEESSHDPHAIQVAPEDRLLELGRLSPPSAPGDNFPLSAGRR